MRAYLIKLLSQREHSRKELLRKLKTKEFFHDFDPTSLLDELIDQGYQSDERYSTVFLRTRKNSGYGPNRIKNELQQRGVDPDIIVNTLKLSDINWQDHCRKVFESKFGEAADSNKELAKQARFLYHRGFDISHIKETLGRLP